MPHTCSFGEQLFHFIKKTNTFTERLRLDRITSNDENTKKIHKLENKLYPHPKHTCIKAVHMHIAHILEQENQLFLNRSHDLHCFLFLYLFLKLAMLIGD